MDERRNKNRIRFAEAEREARDGRSAASGEGRGSFGSWLRTQREARGVTVDDIADRSKISRRYLEALETDRFDALPAPVFVRGFLREYARIVGLDADEVVNFYLATRPPAPRERPAVAAAAAAVAVERKPSSRRALIGYGVLLVALVALFVGIAAAISWWAGERTARVEPATGVGSIPPPARSAAPEDRTTREEPGRETPEPAEPPAEEVVPPAEEIEPPAGEAVNVAAVATGSDSLSVVLEFQQDCWVEVVVDGRRRESELKAGGETLAIEAREYVLLTLGNAPAVRVEVDGEPYPLALGGSRVVRELRIERSAPGAAAAPPAR